MELPAETVRFTLGKSASSDPAISVERTLRDTEIIRFISRIISVVPHFAVDRSGVVLILTILPILTLGLFGFVLALFFGTPQG